MASTRHEVGQIMHNCVRWLTLALAIGCGVLASGIGVMGAAAQAVTEPCEYQEICLGDLYSETRFPDRICQTDICCGLNQPPLGDSVLVVPKEGRDYPCFPRP